MQKVEGSIPGGDGNDLYSAIDAQAYCLVRKW